MVFFLGQDLVKFRPQTKKCHVKVLRYRACVDFNAIFASNFL